jgi:hypothetical protein
MKESSYKSVSPRALQKLYEDAQKIQEKKDLMGQEIYRKMSPFSPRLISKQTKQDRNYNTLYEDAMRRVHSPASDKRGNSPNQAMSMKRNNEYLRKRFMNDFDQLMS